MESVNALQPLTECCNSRLRPDWQRDSKRMSTLEISGNRERACHPAAFSRILRSMEAEIDDKLPSNSR